MDRVRLVERQRMSVEEDHFRMTDQAILVRYTCAISRSCSEWKCGRGSHGCMGSWEAVMGLRVPAPWPAAVRLYQRTLGKWPRDRLALRRGIVETPVRCVVCQD